MRDLGTMIHPSIDVNNDNLFKRVAARAIVLKDGKILLLYTKRYNDYSLPGGGVDDEEHIEEGLIRELEEETGAKDIKVLSEYGILEEFRPYHKKEYHGMHMISHFYICDIHKELGETSYEDYEIKNGMKALWIDIEEAISHNKKVMEEKEETMGLSIERETKILELIKKEHLL